MDKLEPRVYQARPVSLVREVCLDPLVRQDREERPDYRVSLDPRD